MLFGYARVCGVHRDAEQQVHVLLRAGASRDNIYLDHASGSTASRPQWDRLFDRLRSGDTVKCTRLDRIARSLPHLVALGTDLRERGIELHVIEQNIDTTTARGATMFAMLDVLTEYQRELVRVATSERPAAARARGRVGGRKPKLTETQATQAQELYDAKSMTVQQIADLLQVRRSTVYGYLNR